MNATRLGDGWSSTQTDIERERETEIDRQTDRQADRETDRKMQRENCCNARSTAVVGSRRNTKTTSRVRFAVPVTPYTAICHCRKQTDRKTQTDRQIKQTDRQTETLL